MLNEDWKKQYNSDMDRQKPSDKSLEKLKGAMINMPKEKPETKKTGIGTFAALAACVAIVIMVAIPLSTSLLKKETPAATTAAPLPSSKVMSYAEIYDVISTLNNNEIYANGYAAKGGVEQAPTTRMSVEMNSAATREYSDTNLQVAGVQESDIVKTDGEYIYALSDERILIISASDGTLKKVSELQGSEINENGLQKSYASEMYVTENRLVVLKHFYQYSYEEKVTDAAAAKPVPGGRYPQYSKTTVGVVIYDITDRSAPKYLGSYSQSGNYLSSRMIDDVVYLISNEGLYSINKEDPTTYIPMIYKENEGAPLLPEDIRISIDPSYGYSAQYLVVSGIDTEKCELKSSKSVLGYGNNIYSSLENLYVTSYSQIKEGGTISGATKIFKFSIDKGAIELKSESTIPGSLLNQFSMDEYKDVLRVVTTVNSFTTTGMDKSASFVFLGGQYNCLYTLDSDLNIIGKIENLASGEHVYSVRFDGDVGYFVTFRQVDPLFTVDLSDSKNPAIQSELKIPGFSEYLHPYGEGLLFGLGRDADATSGRAGFMKLSMFNIADPKNVSEANKAIIEGVYYSEASYNHKAILINSEKNIIAFPTDGNYLIYSYSTENGFKQQSIISLVTDPKDTPYYYYQNMRGLYINDFLYIMTDNGITSFSMLDYKQFSSLSF